MRRLILLVGLTAVVVAFGMANGHRVPVSFVIGEPVQVRQIFLLAAAAAVGVVGTVLAQQLARITRRREREELRAALRMADAKRAVVGGKAEGGERRARPLEPRPRKPGLLRERRSEPGALPARAERPPQGTRRARSEPPARSARPARGRADENERDDVEE